MALDLWSTPAVFFLLEEVLRFSGILHLTAPCTRLGARLGTTLGEHRPNAGRKHRQHGADNQIKAIRKIIEVGITWYN